LVRTFSFSPGDAIWSNSFREESRPEGAIHDMASGRAALGREFRDVFDDGGVLLLQPGLRSDSGRRYLLWCLDFETQRERWRVEYLEEDFGCTGSTRA